MAKKQESKVIKMMKPYIICHMMTSVDGRIDCGMTAQLSGVSDYYTTLNELDATTRISGRITDQDELAGGRLFKAQNQTPINHAGFSKKQLADSYNIVMDTRGTLLWENDINNLKPHLIITSEQVSQAYLDYLDTQNISWIAVGTNHIDLTKAMDVLAREFKVQRLAIVGGGRIDGAFLDADLIDEISILIGAGADGRVQQPTLFDGRPVTRKPVPLSLKNVQSFEDGGVWLRYLVKNQNV
ncbi:RibD family protein [Pediococcus pentosaceus]|uniref:RibD family protein n=1 Tax=Pediococcus pentosaceus TaxID=1255 RepID=UPI001F2D423D|nr:dihydrofolate reductase family protein [Pediococcus pentosaceus]WPK16970.1 dihydrofolate reductase family protein [Pediococcus pentosaceus]